MILPSLLTNIICPTKCTLPSKCQRIIQPANETKPCVFSSFSRVTVEPLLTDPFLGPTPLPKEHSVQSQGSRLRNLCHSVISQSNNFGFKAVFTLSVIKPKPNHHLTIRLLGQSQTEVKLKPK